MSARACILPPVPDGVAPLDAAQGLVALPELARLRWALRVLADELLAVEGERDELLVRLDEARRIAHAEADRAEALARVLRVVAIGCAPTGAPS